MSWVNEATAVFRKEVQTEWRTRVALSATVLFAACSLTLIGLSLRDKDSAAVEPGVAAALLWVVLLFTAATGLGRAFIQEEERGTMLTLRLTAQASTVWTGKFVANAVLLLLLALISAPTLLAMVAVPVVNTAVLCCVLILGCIGAAAVFTTTSALVAEASAKGGLLAVLSFPLLIPLLQAGVHGTKIALGVGLTPTGSAFALASGDLQLLGSYAVVAVTASVMLFDFLWEG
ncbi:MAG: heme exporter protein CcmB [Armatimonadaceae bacterium]